MKKKAKQKWSAIFAVPAITLTTVSYTHLDVYKRQVLRSAIMSGMSAFIPLFWLSVLMQSEEVSGLTTSVIAISGAVATFVGGRLADRIGCLLYTSRCV